MTSVPDWVLDYAQDCRRLLGIDDGWRITFTMTDPPAGEQWAGQTQYDTAYLNATVELAASLVDGAAGRQVILHELLHVALAPLYGAAEYAWRTAGSAEGLLLRSVYNDAEENVIQRMSRAMSRTIRPEDA